MTVGNTVICTVVAAVVGLIDCVLPVTEDDVMVEVVAIMLKAEKLRWMTK